MGCQPSFVGMPIDDRRMYPIYVRAAELGLPVAVHTGINYTTHHPIKNDHPLQVDQVACDLPDVTIIACHAGWPWVTDMVAVHAEAPRVFAEFGGLAPKYVLAQNTGWEVMHRFMNSVLSEQVLLRHGLAGVPDGQGPGRVAGGRPARPRAGGTDRRQRGPAARRS